MIYTLVFTAAVAAAFIPYSLDLNQPFLERRFIWHDESSILERRLMSIRQGKVKTQQGKKDQIVVPPESLTPKTGRSNSPAREGDTLATGKLIGPGQITTQRKESKPAVDTAMAVAGQRVTKETHDAQWSRAEVQSVGRPQSGQRPLLHPAKVEGVGRNGRLELDPPQGGYGMVKKKVNGVIVKDQRVPGGRQAVEEHHGSQPGEVKLSGSTSAGGTAALKMTNDDLGG